MRQATAPGSTPTPKLNMNNLGWCPLQERRAKLKVTLLYKILNDLSIVNKTDLIPTNSPSRPYCFLVPHSSKDPHLHSFFPSTIRFLNSLPLIIKNSSSLSGFKEAVGKHLMGGLPYRHASLFSNHIQFRPSYLISCVFLYIQGFYNMFYAILICHLI